MEVQQRNSTKIYALSTGPSLPEWISSKAKRNLSKRDSNIRRRIELLQDFSMPVSSQRLLQSKDGRYILACGTYSPRIRCYELEQLSMKFERYVDAEVVDMTLLGDDYGKMALLLSDRSVLFHAPYGQHHTVRIPTFGRMLAYEPTTCELMIACTGKAGRNSISKTHGGGEVYRINLEEGRFSAPLHYSASDSLASSSAAPVVAGNCIAVSPTHALTALGGDDGIIRFWDNRIPPSDAKDDLHLHPFCNLDVKSSTAGYGFYDNQQYTNNIYHHHPGAVTSIAYDSSGMFLAAGTQGGNVALYDIRSSKPLHVKEHQYGMPIHTVRFHSSSGTIMSGDAKLVKIWRAKPSAAISHGTNGTASDYGTAVGGDLSSSSSSSIGSIVANIEGSANFNHFIVAGDEKDSSGNQSGLVLCATEQPKIQAFYSPILGTAPKWCSFLDSITEELEEKDQSRSTTNDTSTSATNSNIADDSKMDIDGNLTGSIYEDYKFLTRSEIDALNMQHLVGTPLLRGYMHGFFVNIGLYNKIRSVANPFEYEEYRKRKIREKMEEKRKSRIAPKKVPTKKKVNAELADRLESKASTSGGNRKQAKSSKVAQQLLEDDRFGSLFNNPDYEIDEEDINFKLRNPSGVKQSNMAERDMDSDEDDDDDDYDQVNDNAYFKKVQRSDDDEDSWGGRKDDYYDDDDNEDDVENHDSDSDDDGFIGGKIRGENYNQMKAMERQLKNSSKKNKKNKSASNKNKKDKSKKKSKKTTMYEVDGYYDGESEKDAIQLGLGGGGGSSQSERKNVLEKQRRQRSMPLEERLKLEQEKSSHMSDMKRLNVRGEGATKEVTYLPKDAQVKAAKKHGILDDDHDRQGSTKSKRKRRGIKDLGFKTPFKHTN